MSACTSLSCSDTLWWSSPSACWLRHDSRPPFVLFLSVPRSMPFGPQFLSSNFCSQESNCSLNLVDGESVFWLGILGPFDRVRLSGMLDSLTFRRWSTTRWLFLVFQVALKESIGHLFRAKISLVHPNWRVTMIGSTFPLLGTLTWVKGFCLLRQLLPLQCEANLVSNITDLIAISLDMSSTLPGFQRDSNLSFWDMLGSNPLEAVPLLWAYMRLDVLKTIPAVMRRNSRCVKKGCFCDTQGPDGIS